MVITLVHGIWAKRAPWIRILIIIGLVLHAGCSGCNAKLETIVLTPSQVATAVKRQYHYHKEPWVVSCPKTAARENFSCYGEYGVSPDATADAPIAVGLRHDYGSGALFGVIEGCDERINCIYRGLVLFDLTALGPNPKVVTAKLKYQGSFDKHNDATHWSETEDCIARIGFITSSWGGFDVPAEFLGGDISAAGYAQGVEVTSVVRGWADGSVPNHGFMLTGPQEGVGKNDDDRCVAKLSSLRLETRINVGQK